MYLARRAGSVPPWTNSHHCLFDLLWRWRRGEWDAEIVAVISNHRHHVPVRRVAGSGPTQRCSPF